MWQLGWKNEIVMLKTQPRCTGVESKLTGRVLGEAKQNSFIALPGKEGHRRIMTLKTVCPNLEGFGEEFYSNGSRAELLIRIRACAVPAVL